MSRAGRPSGPAVVYLALTVVLVVLVASLAFSARQPPPPQIAELTPQAQHQITRAPNQLGSSIGSAKGGSCTGSSPCGQGSGSGSGSRTTASSTAAPAPSAPLNPVAVHHCFGDPPRQISFDTQSPPCVSYWAGNNGGATSMGVSATQVKVLVDPAGPYTAGNTAGRVVTDLQSFFNRTFEFYGRVLNLVPVNYASGACSYAASVADGAYQTYHPFAATAISNTEEQCQSTELARDHVVEASLNGLMSQQVMAAEAPYLWEYPMSWDQDLARTGKFVCGQLAGRDAIYAGDPLLHSKPRRFGLILEYLQSPTPYSSEALTKVLASCGVTLAANENYDDPEDSNQFEESAAFGREAAVKMQAAGVTTVICFCSQDLAMEATIPSAATSQDYHPEWVLAWENSLNSTVKDLWEDQGQGQGLMDLTSHPEHVPYPDTTLNQALAAVDPGFQISQNQGVGGYLGYQNVYWELLLIASGIQMAGPDLTPYTFERGLQLARFPNPFSPAQEGVVGFGSGDHSMTSDTAVAWWSNTAVGPYPDEGAGAWCYVDEGRRFSGAAWSAPMDLFSGPCASSPAGA